MSMEDQLSEIPSQQIVGITTFLTLQVNKK